MSSYAPNDKSQNQEHGTFNAYVIGFLLSLLFTFIPYLLVVNKVLSGNSLMFTILAFAMLQLLIQITFFLHIGRGPKPNWNLYFFVATVGTILIIVAGSILIINNLDYNMRPSDLAQRALSEEGIYQINGKRTGVCQATYDNHQIKIEGKQLSPFATYAQQCDTLTFINKSDQTRKIAFGQYPSLSPYAGEDVIVLSPRRYKTISLSDSGKFQFYDQTTPALYGSFAVSPRQ